MLMNKYVKGSLETLPNKDQCTVISSWYNQDGDWKHYFTLYTTQEYEEKRYSPTSKTKIIVETVSVDNILNSIPEDLSSGSASGKLEAGLDDEKAISFDFSSDIRMQYRTSQKMRSWGSSWPSLCFEHWIETDYDEEIISEDEEELLDILEQEYNIKLFENKEYVGNIIIAVENRSCRVVFNEGPEELLDIWMADDETLSDNQLLTLLDSWGIILDNIKRSAIDITLRREEFGNLLYEEEISLSAEKIISEEKAIELAKDDPLTTTLKITVDGETERYKLDQIESPGASDELLKVSKNGKLLDEYSMPIVRQVETSISINPSTSNSGGRVLPPTLYSEPTVTSGKRNWDKFVASGSKENFETWVVDDDEDYDEVMDIIYKQLAGVVKISEPYLRPDKLEEFVQEGESDLDLWVVLGHNSRHMKNMRSDFKDCVSTANSAGKDLHILWLPGEESTPLHDRFIINESTGLTIGTSFNSLDSNITVVSKIPKTQSQQLETNFDYWWENKTFRRQNSVEIIGST